KRSGQRGGDERTEIDGPFDPVDLREPLAEREDQQEREQNLHARKRGPEVVQQLDELAVDALLLVLPRSFAHHGLVPVATASYARALTGCRVPPARARWPGTAP